MMRTFELFLFLCFITTLVTAGNECDQWGQLPCGDYTDDGVFNVDYRCCNVLQVCCTEDWLTGVCCLGPGKCPFCLNWDTNMGKPPSCCSS